MVQMHFGRKLKVGNITAPKIRSRFNDQWSSAVAMTRATNRRFTNVLVIVILVSFYFCGGWAFTRARTDGDASAGWCHDNHWTRGEYSPYRRRRWSADSNNVCHRPRPSKCAGTRRGWSTWHEPPVSRKKNKSVILFRNKLIKRQKTSFATRRWIESFRMNESTVKQAKLLKSKHKLTSASSPGSVAASGGVTYREKSGKYSSNRDFPARTFSASRSWKNHFQIKGGK